MSSVDCVYIYAFICVGDNNRKRAKNLRESKRRHREGWRERNGKGDMI